MTTNQETLIRRFAWLCDELIAGNQFSREQLGVWLDRARSELQANGWQGVERLAREFQG